MEDKLRKLAKLLRYYSLVSTTEAGSGHPSSALSAADLMAVLCFGPSRQGGAEAGGFYRFDLNNPEFFNNDRLIFSKGHAAPLLYSIYAVAGQPQKPPPYSPPILGGERGGKASPAKDLKRAMDPKEMLTLRKFNSRLEGHPTMEFPYTEVSTGSLGQGLSVGVGMALNAKMDKLSYRTFVLLGDSEMAEGSVWEAMEIAAYYKLDNLIAILDVNRLGQRGETLYGHHLEKYQKKTEAFGWETAVIDGHNLDEITEALEWACGLDGNLTSPVSSPRQERREQPPKIIIAKTLKGRGVSFIEDKDGWHGKPLSAEELDSALEELGEVDKSLVGIITSPERITSPRPSPISERAPKAGEVKITEYKKDDKVATRKAYGNALANLVEANPNVVVLDAETSNSTYSESVKKTHPEKFIECFIAEQNMVGMALGLSRHGKIPFVSTFAAFFTRAFDQIRMSQYAKSNIKFCGSHAGVSIGEDGASQMGLEDIAMFRTLLDCVVLYPSDAVSTERLVAEAAQHQGNVFIRTTRSATPIIYEVPHPNPPHQEEGNKKIDSSPLRGEGREGVEHDFKIGGSCILKSSDNDRATIIAAGITLHEALKAYEELKKEGINIRVIDLYSIKPLDIKTLQKAAKETGVLITAEDHFKEGGIGEAVAGALCTYEIHHILEGLAVTKMPKSGKPEELLNYEEINASAIIKKVKTLLNTD